MAYYKKSINKDMYKVTSFYAEEELNRIKEEAIKEDRSISNYIRSIVIKELRSEG